MKEHIYNIVERGANGNKFNRTFDIAILILILCSVFSIILESVSSINNRFGDQLKDFNTFTIAVFSIEYLLRLYISDRTHPSDNRIKSMVKFAFSFYGLIDLLAILPFYLPLLFTVDLRFIRVLRLVRITRLLKLNRYNNSIHLIVEVIREKKDELAITGFFAFLVILLSSFIMYFIEGEAQPEQFPNVLAGFWWAINTLTTVGYGDVYPITALGKIISGIISILGIGLIALPTGLISSGFMKKIEDKNHRDVCPHCGKKI